MSPARGENSGAMSLWVRETLWPLLKTLAVVVPVTMLIWIIAESESLRVEKHRIEIVLGSSPASARAIRLGEGDFSGSAMVTIQGPTARVDAVVARLRGPIVLEPGTPGVPLDPGAALVDLKAAIAAHPAVREGRVTIAEVEPASVSVVIENVIEREAVVRVERPTMWHGAAWAGSAWDQMAVEASPGRVRVRVSESQAKLLEESGGEAVVVARVAASSMEGLVEGRSAVISAVPIELPAGLRMGAGSGQVRVAPSQVTVTLTPRAK